MTTCLAIIQKPEGLKGCRNYAIIQKDEAGNDIRCIFCSIHKKYFNIPHSENLAKSSSNLHYRNASIRERIEECIALGIIGPPQRLVETLIGNNRIYDRYAYYMMLCAKYGKIQPSWNRTFWTGIVRQLWFWHGSFAIGPIVITWSDMRHMVCVKGDIETLYSGLLAFPIERWEHVAEDYNWIYFLDGCADADPVWFLDFWMTDTEKHTAVLDQLSKRAEMRDHPIMKFLRGYTFNQWLLRKKELFYVLQRIPCALKGEINAVGNHPLRYRDWVLTNEEKKEIHMAWASEPERGSLAIVLEEVDSAGGGLLATTINEVCTG